MTRDGFLSRFGTVFENRPDLAAAAWDRGPVDPAAGGAEGVHRAFVAVLRGLGISRPTRSASRVRPAWTAWVPPRAPASWS